MSLNIRRENAKPLTPNLGNIRLYSHGDDDDFSRCTVTVEFTTLVADTSEKKIKRKYDLKISAEQCNLPWKGWPLYQPEVSALLILRLNTG